MRKLLISVCALGVLALNVLEPCLQAQGNGSTRRARVQAEQTDSILAVRPPRSALFSTVPTGFLEVEEANSRATVSGGWHLTGVGWPNLTAKLEASTPLSDGDAPVSFGGHAGLSSGTTLTFSLTGTRWRLRAVAPDSMLKWCRNVQREARARGDTETLKEITCGRVSPDSLEQSMSDELYGRYLLETGWTEPWIFDVNGSVGRSTFQFLDANTFAPGSRDEYGWAVGADLGRYMGGMLWSGGIHYKTEHEAQPKAEICVPIGTEGAIRCRSGALGSPTETRAWTADFQMRGFFGRNARVGLNPSVEVDLEETSLEARLPIYFLANADGALVGGISPSYQSHAEEHWTLNIFLGLKAPLRMGLR
jgi:hypothetical protein